MSDERPETVDVEEGGGVEPPSSDGASADEVERELSTLELDAQELLARLQDAEREHEKVMDDLRRVAADFDNYRKRVAREQVEWTSRANERLLNELLPVLDDLERAHEAAAEHEEAKLEEGVALVARSLSDTLRKEGLEEVQTEGKFDPHVHEALLAQPGEGAEEGAVLQVLQKGYRLGDKVLRPARVIVAE